MKQTKLEKFRAWNKKGLAERLVPGYVFHPFIFRLALVLSFLAVIIVAASEGFDFKQHIYFKCPENGPICPNPFYYKNYENLLLDASVECPDPELCAIQWFSPGSSFGIPPNPLMAWFYWMLSIVWILAFSFNHFLFNKNYKFTEDKA